MYQEHHKQYRLKNISKSRGWIQVETVMLCLSANTLKLKKDYAKVYSSISTTSLMIRWLFSYRCLTPFNRVSLPSMHTGTAKWGAAIDTWSLVTSCYSQNSSFHLQPEQGPNWPKWKHLCGCVGPLNLSSRAIFSDKHQNFGKNVFAVPLWVRREWIIISLLMEQR